MAELRAAAQEDLAVVRLLLEQAGLPTSDLTTSRPQFTVLWDDERIVGAGALEPFGSAALMRSVVVARDRRAAGLGRLIVQELERVARAARIDRLILLTQSALQISLHVAVIERLSGSMCRETSGEARSFARRVRPLRPA